MNKTGAERRWTEDEETDNGNVNDVRQHRETFNIYCFDAHGTDVDVWRYRDRLQLTNGEIKMIGFLFANSSGGVLGILGTQIFYLLLIGLGLLLFYVIPNFLKKILTKNKRMSEEQKEEYFQRIWCWIWGIFFVAIFLVVAAIIIVGNLSE